MTARHRQARDLRRAKAKRPPYDRLLIVCEGKKTEPTYLNDIRMSLRLPAAHIQVLHSELGTDPIQVVESAKQHFLNNRAFEAVYAVFDRDDHRGYANAIEMAQAFDGKLRNDEGTPVAFKAIVSVPCFELWLLLHFQEQTGSLHRHDALRLLKTHLPRYAKGAAEIYATTAPQLDQAKTRATRLRQQFQRLPGHDTYTDMDLLVAALHDQHFKLP